MTIERTRRMRKDMTPPEAALWVRLRALRADGWHFRRQAPEAGYILDFVCRSAALVVEVDGAFHSGAAQSAHDQMRDSVLAQRGLRVLRFWANDVQRELDGVCETILNGLRETDPTRRAARDTLPVPGREPGRRYQRLVRLGLRKTRPEPRS